MSRPEGPKWYRRTRDYLNARPGLEERLVASLPPDKRAEFLRRLDQEDARDAADRLLEVGAKLGGAMCRVQGKVKAGLA